MQLAQHPLVRSLAFGQHLNNLMREAIQIVICWVLSEHKAAAAFFVCNPPAATATYSVR
jgi:hypothetical protein